MGSLKTLNSSFQKKFSKRCKYVLSFHKLKGFDLDESQLYWYSKSFPDVQIDEAKFSEEKEIKDRIDAIKDMEFRAQKMMKELLKSWCILQFIYESKNKFVRLYGFFLRVVKNNTGVFALM